MQQLPGHGGVLLRDLVWSRGTVFCSRGTVLCMQSGLCIKGMVCLNGYISRYLGGMSKLFLRHYDVKGGIASDANFFVCVLLSFC